jgi:hypothetical protein
MDGGGGRLNGVILVVGKAERYVRVAPDGRAIDDAKRAATSRGLLSRVGEISQLGSALTGSPLGPDVRPLGGVRREERP